MTRRRVAILLIFIATVLGIFAIFALWANRQLLDTDNWTRTSSSLLDNEEIRTQAGDFIIDAVYANVDVQAELERFEEVRSRRPQARWPVRLPAVSRRSPSNA